MISGVNEICTISFDITNFTKIKIKTIITLKPYIFDWFFQTSKTILFYILPFNILQKFIFRFCCHSELMICIFSKMLFVNYNWIKITVLANIVILTLHTDKTRPNNRLLKAEFTSIIIMHIHSICK